MPGRSFAADGRLRGLVVKVAIALGVATLSAVTIRPFAAGASIGEQRTSASSAACTNELAGVQVTNVHPDYNLDATTRAYADAHRGWSGGDGGESVGLPGGGIAWLDDDIYLGRVIHDHRPFLHNAIVVQTGAKFRTLYNDPDGHLSAFMNYHRAPGYFYWSHSGVVSGNTLYVEYGMYHYPKGPSQYGFVHVETVLAAFALASFNLESVTVVNDARGILWGVWMSTFGGYTYIYGTGTAGTGIGIYNLMYVARVPAGQLLSPWTYFDGRNWDSNPSAARPVSDAAAALYSVSQMGDLYVLTTMRNRFESKAMMMFFACRPTGPFVDGRIIYDTMGRPGIYGTDGIPRVYTYGAVAHPELTDGNQMILSYDVNSADWPFLNADANVVRPRYVGITVTTGIGTNSR